MNRNKIVNETLDQRGFSAELLSDSPTLTAQLEEVMNNELTHIMKLTYGKELTPAHLKYCPWAITIKKVDTDEIIAACTLSFYWDEPCYFQTRFEAVAPEYQRSGIGRAMFECVESATKFISMHDLYVASNLVQNGLTYDIVSMIDSNDINLKDNNTEGHGTFLKKLGFQVTDYDYNQDTNMEIAFFKRIQLEVLMDTQIDSNLSSGSTESTITADSN